MAFEHVLRVRFGEADPQGIVFNAHYVAWFDVALTELFRAALGSWDAMVKRGVDAVVAEINVRFLSPARADDLVTLRVAVEELGTTSMLLTCDVLRDGELLAEGRLRHVFVDAETWAKTPVPDFVRAGLAPYLVTPAPPGASAPPASSGS
jgi:acyl-CoA thioester hydrolase